MPNGSVVYPQGLMDAIFYMKDKKMFKQMVIYWASDYAEQVFDTLPGNYSVFGIASSGRNEQQQNTYCPPDDVHAGYTIGACMATEFGAVWLQESFSGDLSQISLFKQASALRQ